MAKKKISKGEKALVSGENRIIVRSEKGMIGYQGGTPFVEFDENWIQMPLDRTETIIPREHLTRMFPLGYLAGKLSVLKKMENLSMIMILILVASIVAAALGGWNYYTTNNKLNTQDSRISSLQNQSDINHNYIRAIAAEFNITSIEQPIEQVG